MFEVEELHFDLLVEGFDIALVVLLAGRDEAVAGAEDVLDDVRKAAVAFGLSLRAGVLAAVVGLDRGEACGIEPASLEMGAHGRHEDAGVGGGEVLCEAEECASGLGVAVRVFEAREPRVAAHLVDVVWDVVEILCVDLRLLESGPTGLYLAHVTLLLVLFLSQFGEALLAQDARDGPLARPKQTELLEAAWAKAGSLLSLTHDGLLLRFGGLVRAALGRARAIHERGARVVIRAPATQPLAYGLHLTAEGARGRLDAVI